MSDPDDKKWKADLNLAAEERAAYT